MIYFTSDLHLNHKNICRGVSQWSDKSTCRDFDTVEEMNDAIFDSINSRVMPEDILYHLGDFNFGDKTQTPALRERIRCRTIYSLRGNHDFHLERYKDLFVWLKDYHEERIQLASGKKQFIVMFHYPITSWNEIGRGSWCLSGHTHGNLDTKFRHGKSLDLGWDVWKRPLDIEEIRAIMDTKSVVEVDGHNERTNYG